MGRAISLDKNRMGDFLNFDVTVSLSHFVINLIGEEGGAVNWVKSFRLT